MGEDREKYSCTGEPKLARTRGAVIAVWAILAFAVWPILWVVVLAGGWSALWAIEQLPEGYPLPGDWVSTFLIFWASPLFAAFLCYKLGRFLTVPWSQASREGFAWNTAVGVVIAAACTAAFWYFIVMVLSQP